MISSICTSSGLGLARSNRLPYLVVTTVFISHFHKYRPRSVCVDGRVSPPSKLYQKYFSGKSLRSNEPNYGDHFFRDPLSKEASERIERIEDDISREGLNVPFFVFLLPHEISILRVNGGRLRSLSRFFPRREPLPELSLRRVPRRASMSTNTSIPCRLLFFPRFSRAILAPRSSISLLLQ